MKEDNIKLRGNEEQETGPLDRSCHDNDAGNDDDVGDAYDEKEEQEIRVSQAEEERACGCPDQEAPQGEGCHLELPA